MWLSGGCWLTAVRVAGVALQTCAQQARPLCCWYRGMDRCASVMRLLVNQLQRCSTHLDVCSAASRNLGRSASCDAPEYMQYRAEPRPWRGASSRRTKHRCRFPGTARPFCDSCRMRACGLSSQGVYSWLHNCLSALKLQNMSTNASSMSQARAGNTKHHASLSCITAAALAADTATGSSPGPAAAAGGRCPRVTPSGSGRTAQSRCGASPCTRPPPRTCPATAQPSWRGAAEYMVVVHLPVAARYSCVMADGVVCYARCYA